MPSNRGELWTQLLIDTRHSDSAAAGKYFDQLQEDKVGIEARFGRGLEWDNRTNQYAVRIYTKRPFQFDAPPEELEEAMTWALSSFLQLEQIMAQPIIELT